ncbi:MAG TPA: PIN domain-containing protein [Thermoanaerobaculia bacterium]|nr:PIN domain-containing protein [Thermoanaerobaculia bacterium]
MGLLSDIGAGPLGLDSAIFIYYMEENPRYLPLVDLIFDAVIEGRLTVATSALTLLETQVVPLRAGNEVLARQYERFLTRSESLRLVPIDHGLLRAAAHVRATTRLKTPDALHVAAALSADCPVFLTNDGRIPSLPGLRVLQLEDYAKPSA